MKTYAIIFFLLLLHSCASINPKGPAITENTCYVKWKKPEYKQTYLKAITTTRAELEARGELIPLHQNGGIFVRSLLKDNHYSILFDYSDPHSNRLVDRISDEYFNEIEPQLKNALRTATFKVTEKDLKQMLERYEPVSCDLYMAAQEMPQVQR